MNSITVRSNYNFFAKIKNQSSEVQKIDQKKYKWRIPDSNRSPQHCQCCALAK